MGDGDGLHSPREALRCFPDGGLVAVYRILVGLLGPGIVCVREIAATLISDMTGKGFAPVRRQPQTGASDAEVRGPHLDSLAWKNNLDYREGMGVLQSAVPAIVICTRDRARATQFYRDTLGLALAREDRFAAVFAAGGVTLRVSHVPDFTPHEHTILGFVVPEVASTVDALTRQGVRFNRYTGVQQDERGILTLFDGKHVAWFSDPDGNVLSVTDAA